MTNTQDTSPEAVERMAKDHDEVGNSPDKYVMGHPHHWKIAATLRALSAERTALKAGLAEAVGVLQMIVGGAVYTAADGFSKPHEPEQSRIARAFLARHQKGTSHD